MKVLIITKRCLCNILTNKYKCLAVLIILIVILSFSHLGEVLNEKIKYEHPDFCGEPIDVVYTWVNGSDLEFRKSLDQYVNGGESYEFKDYSEERFDDKYELKFSLRSLEKYAPWIRHVYIVTNGQIPYWLNLDYERVTVISHDQLFPDQNSLPTFSSPAIESNIHRIPGLSKRFIYFNDDVFLNAPTYPDDFLSPNRGYLIYLAWPLPSCVPNCPWAYVGDGQCDISCFNQECQFDGGDCTQDYSASKLKTFQIDEMINEENSNEYDNYDEPKILAKRQTQNGGERFDTVSDQINIPNITNNSLIYTKHDDQLKYSIQNGGLNYNLTQNGDLTHNNTQNGDLYHRTKQNTHLNNTIRRNEDLTYNITQIGTNTLQNGDNTIQNVDLYHRTKQNSASVVNTIQNNGLYRNKKQIVDLYKNITQYDTNTLQNGDDIIQNVELYDRTKQTTVSNTNTIQNNGLYRKKRQIVDLYANITQNGTNTLQNGDDIIQNVDLYHRTKQNSVSNSNTIKYNDLYRNKRQIVDLYENITQNGTNTIQNGDDTIQNVGLSHRTKQNTASNNNTIQNNGLYRFKTQIVDLYSNITQNGTNTLQNGDDTIQNFDLYDRIKQNTVSITNTIQNNGLYRNKRQIVDLYANITQNVDLTHNITQNGDWKYKRKSKMNKNNTINSSVVNLNTSVIKVDIKSVLLTNTSHISHLVDEHNRKILLNDKLKRKKRLYRTMKKRKKYYKNMFYNATHNGYEINNNRTKIKELDTYAASLQHTNRVFNEAYGYKARKVPAHAPIFIDTTIMTELQRKFRKEFEITRNNKIRSENDMQYSFSYYYYLIQEKLQKNIGEIFDEFDTDSSGTWSDREIRTVLTRINILPLNYKMVEIFDDAIINCSNHLKVPDISTPAYERYIDSKLPTVSKYLVTNCQFLVVLLKDNFGESPRYQHEIIKNAHNQQVMFKMLTSNISEVVGHLDEIRKNSRKFVCLNDNMDPKKLEDNDLVKSILFDFYLSLFPKPSKFELPQEYRNRFLYLKDLIEWKQYHYKLKLFLFVCVIILCNISFYNICKRKFARQIKRIIYF